MNLKVLIKYNYFKTISDGAGVIYDGKNNRR